MKQRDYKAKFRNFIHDFIKERLSEIKDSYSHLGFKDAKDMLKQIKNDDQVAMWAFTELMYWDMGREYYKDYQVGEINDETPVFKVDDFYFICDFNTCTIKQCDCEVRMVEVKTFKIREE